jgi:hypothetical protein
MRDERGGGGVRQPQHGPYVCSSDRQATDATQTRARKKKNDDRRRTTTMEGRTRSEMTSR